MAKFNVGDKVRVKKFDTIELLKRISTEMYYLSGVEVTIAKVIGDELYLIEEDMMGYTWDEDMLEIITTRQFEVVCDSKRKHLDSTIQLPTRGTKSAIAYDIYSPVDITIEPMSNGMIWTDVKARFNEDEALLINVRSSMGKQPIMLANSQGWVESDYCDNEGNDGNLGVNLFNLGKTPYVIKKGDRIAQAMFIKYLASDNGNVDTVRKGGFGSTN